MNAAVLVEKPDGHGAHLFRLNPPGTDDIVGAPVQICGRARYKTKPIDPGHGNPGGPVLLFNDVPSGKEIALAAGDWFVRRIIIKVPVFWRSEVRRQLPDQCFSLREIRVIGDQADVGFRLPYRAHDKRRLIRIVIPHVNGFAGQDLDVIRLAPVIFFLVFPAVEIIFVPCKRLLRGLDLDFGGIGRVRGTRVTVAPLVRRKQRFKPCLVRVVLGKPGFVPDAQRADPHRVKGRVFRHWDYIIAIPGTVYDPSVRFGGPAQMEPAVPVEGVARHRGSDPLKIFFRRGQFPGVFRRIRIIGQRIRPAPDRIKRNVAGDPQRPARQVIQPLPVRLRVPEQELAAGALHEPVGRKHHRALAVPVDGGIGGRRPVEAVGVVGHTAGIGLDKRGVLGVERQILGQPGASPTREVAFPAPIRRRVPGGQDAAVFFEVRGEGQRYIFVDGMEGRIHRDTPLRVAVSIVKDMAAGCPAGGESNPLHARIFSVSVEVPLRKPFGDFFIRICFGNKIDFRGPAQESLPAKAKLLRSPQSRFRREVERLIIDIGSPVRSIEKIGYEPAVLRFCPLRI